MKELKPGVKTSEYWLTILATIGAFVVAILQIAAPEQATQAQTVVDKVLQVAAILLPLALPLILGRDYLVARMSLKTRLLDKGE